MRLGSLTLVVLALFISTDSFAAKRVGAGSKTADPAATGGKAKGKKGKKGKGSQAEPQKADDDDDTSKEPTPAEAAPAPAPSATPAAAPITNMPPAPADPAKPSDNAAPQLREPDRATSTRKGKLIPALRVAVYDLELQDVPTALGVVVTDSLLSEVRKLQGVAAIGMNEIRDMLSHEATKQLAGCSENADSCMAELAGALGVDELVTGKLTQVGDERVVLVRRIDQKRAEVQSTFDQRLKAEKGQELLASVGPAVEKLYAGYQLRDGTTRGVSKEVALKLDPPPIPKWVTITVGALAVGAAGAGGVFGLLALDAQKDYQNMANKGTTTNPVDGATLTAKGRDAQTRATLSTGFFIGAGGTALVAGILALFTDWHGYKDELRQEVREAQAAR